jgi:hemerythrin-like domain-containing protein
MSELNKPNVGADLARIHRVITRGLNVSIERSQSFAQEGYPDEAAREGFVSYVRAFVSVLHSHHLTEDDVAFPYFRAIMPDVPYDSLTAEHQKMVVVLDEIEAAIGEVAADEQVGESLNDLNRALTKIAELWHPHIQKEEAHLRPEEVGVLIDLEEQIRLAKVFAEHSQEHSGPDYLVVPFLLYNLSVEDRAVMSQAMPPVVTQQLVPVVWKEKWEPMSPFLLE